VSVGQVVSGSRWASVPLKRVLMDVKTGFASGMDLSSGVLQIRMNNITQTGHFDFSKQRRVPVEADKIDRLRVLPGDVLFNATNAPGLVGKSALFVGADEPVVFSNHFLRLRCATNLEPAYLSHWLRWQFDRGTFRGMTRQWVNQASINRDQLMAMPIPLPPLAEQRRIASILDHADALRAKRRQTVNLLDTLTQSIFLEMFGDPPLHAQRWTMVPLQDACAAIIDCPHSTPAWTDSGVTCLRTSNLKRGGWQWDEHRYVSEETYHFRSTRAYLAAGDIVLSREGTVGVAAIVPDSMVACMGQRLVQVRSDPKQLLPEYALSYLLWVLDPDRISKLMSGSTSKHLNLKDLRNLQVSLPPISLQTHFAERIACAESIREELIQASAGVQLSTASLQHRAFRGEL